MGNILSTSWIILVRNALFGVVEDKIKVMEHCQNMCGVQLWIRKVFRVMITLLTGISVIWPPSAFGDIIGFKVVMSVCV